MVEIGEPSRAVEEEPRDIRVVYEQAAVAEQPPALSAEEEGSEPGTEFDPEEDPEENPEEGDGAPDPEDEVIGNLLDQNNELENRVRELEEEKQERQAALEGYEALVHHLVAKNAELIARSRDDERKIAEVSLDRDRLGDAWSRAARRVDLLEREVRTKKVKIDLMNYAFNTAFGRWKERVYEYPAEEGQTRHTMSRRLMIQIGQQEHEDALRRGMLQ